MDIKIVTDVEDFDSLKDEWNALAFRSDAHIYQTFEWNRIWWKHFGANGSLHIILVYSDNRLTGIAPLFWDTIRFAGRAFYSGLRFLGSNVSQPRGEPLIGLVAYSEYLDILVDPLYKEQVGRHLANYFKTENLPYDEIVFEEVPENSVICHNVVPLLKKGKDRFFVRNGTSCANILLDSSWDAYLERLSKNARKKIRGYLKEVEDIDKKVFNLQEVEHPDELSTAYDTLVSLHQKQWNSQGFPGMFYEKRMYEFNKEISREFYKNNWLQIKRLVLIDDTETCIAADLFFAYKKRFYSIIGGMNSEVPVSTKGAGHVIFAVAVKEAIENRYEVFDYIGGLQEYKIRRADRITTNKTVLIQQSGKRHKRRIILFIKKIIGIRRRLRIEFIQFKLVLNQKNITGGIRAYFLFIFRRIAAKKAFKNRENRQDYHRGQ